ncbi:hypothetical protein [Myceligenerans crystallogenes]|uniref:Uncharacterized protein n=1 Tax=Myceligenerans crystallogenes TaxID=316335 RepID=A0ABN2N8B9_9MICO
MSTTIDGGNLGFGTRDAHTDDGTRNYTAPQEISWWIPLVASAGALVVMVVAGSVLFGQVLATAIGAL